MTVFPRISFAFLDNWKKSKDRRPLLVRGARQVGKSFAIRAWGQKTFLKDNFVELNFEEKPQLKTIFQKDLDVDRILNELNFTLGKNLRNPDTLLFLDEIQACPEAITALRYFYEKYPLLYVVGAGSLIEFALRELSFPVGRIESHFIQPLTFCEFLNSIGKKNLSDFIDQHDMASPVSEIIHQELVQLLKYYFRIGGMPAAVNAYIETNDLKEVSKIHSLILQSYEDDFAKYAKKTDWNALRTVFTSIPSYIAKGNIKYTHVDRSSRIDKTKRCINLLELAKVLTKVHATSGTELPLKARAKTNIFKLLFLDIGVLQHALGFDWQLIDPEITLTDLHNGSFAEQFVGQEILGKRSQLNRYQLHYWQREKHGAEAEVDYLIEYNNYPTAVEVKTGERGTLKSLHEFIKEKHPPTSFVLSQLNFARKDSIIWQPLYLACKL